MVNRRTRTSLRINDTVTTLRPDSTGTWALETDRGYTSSHRRGLLSTQIPRQPN